MKLSKKDADVRFFWLKDGLSVNEKIANDHTVKVFSKHNLSFIEFKKMRSKRNWIMYDRLCRIFQCEIMLAELNRLLKQGQYPIFLIGNTGTENIYLYTEVK
jgi:hypothetical protein